MAGTLLSPRTARCAASRWVGDGAWQVCTCRARWHSHSGVDPRTQAVKDFSSVLAIHLARLKWRKAAIVILGAWFIA
jgi:hypothetical protein